MQSLFVTAFMLIASVAAQDDACVSKCADLYLDCCVQAFPTDPSCVAFSNCHLRVINTGNEFLCEGQAQAACQEWCIQDHRLAIDADGTLGCGPSQ
ncbi:hypothetical protein ESCO_005832 [Escovopsis weberi]|uniref:Extracellular membrane protein CFEM domain-containing protein n=1 Tax=Escovopsis weberi TaxID=150374 RepID=A0A0M9VRZ5_ESCWE|nr:hypothetical protein ESCO_005832 [Escovopsis weberi]